MARRNDHTREELRAMAVAAGQEIIANEGFSSFSARKVAASIGYTVGTLHNVFGGRDQLVMHINAATLDQMQDFVARRYDSSLQGSAGLKLMADCYLSFAKTHYECWSALFERAPPPSACRLRTGTCRRWAGCSPWWSSRSGRLWPAKRQPGWRRRPSGPGCMASAPWAWAASLKSWARAQCRS